MSTCVSRPCSSWHLSVFITFMGSNPNVCCLCGSVSVVLSWYYIYSKANTCNKISHLSGNYPPNVFYRALPEWFSIEFSVLHSFLLAYGWRAGNLNWPIRIQCPDVKLKKGIEIRQLFSLEMALNTHEMGFTISKTKLLGSWQKVKNMSHHQCF